MVTDKKIYNTALIKYRLGMLLLWLGILTWLPFIVLRIAGEKPSLLWYLPFHLVGVIGGSRLRASARRELNMIASKRHFLQWLGHALILLGISAWIPYFYLKAIQQPVEVMNFLPYHLTGVFGGLGLLLVHLVITRKNATTS